MASTAGPSRTPVVVAVTGATGYVGGMVCRRLLEREVSVVELGHKPDVISERRSYRYFDLRSAPSPQLFAGVDALIHCGWDLRARSSAEITVVNVLGTRQLIESAVTAGVRRILFTSSLSASAGTTQLYGQSKLASEDDVLGVGGIVARLGLVYGDHAGGMFGALRRVAALPVVPITAADATLFLAHEDDVAEAIIDLALGTDTPTVPLGLAHPTPVAFGDLLRQLARSQRTRNTHFLPIPWRAVRAILETGDRFGLVLPFRADSLLGLVGGPKELAHLEVVEQLGLRFRPFRLGC